MSRILIIEDEVVIRRALRRLLERHHHEITEAGSVGEALDHHDIAAFDLIITDLRLPGAPGTDIIARAGRIPVLVMTSYASVKSAVESIKLGAVDYIAKPFDHDDMVLLVTRILEQGRTQRRLAGLAHDLDQRYPVTGMVGDGPAMQTVFAQIRKVAPTDSTVLISGASGTGKELVARALHAEGKRGEGPFIAVNCASIPERSIESELFGYVKGAFPGALSGHQGLIEAAEGGTLFLDEIGELPLAAQSQLLRVLADGEVRPQGAPHSRRVSVRVVASTQRDLKREIEAGRFREDLYYRLRVIEIHLPTLAERRDDIPSLARFLLARTAQRLNRPPMRFTELAVGAMQEHDWPGNVRELENAIERAVILSDGEEIDLDALALREPSVSATTEDGNPTPPDLSLEDYFRHFVERNQGQMSETELADRLGISRKALWERRQRLGLERPRKSRRK
ncbi:MAG: sigma-54-dependent Fis family transcriptional regulator [Gammaproteobacteria bacterium]|nr:sigma-54-dependent Fis family transcriptional regulator [Gammaproteobacteria bacterium]